MAPFIFIFAYPQSYPKYFISDYRDNLTFYIISFLNNLGVKMLFKKKQNYISFISVASYHTGFSL